MDFISIFNDVLGPVMRGPSSSHTAGSYRIARIARSILGEEPESVKFFFDPGGSYIKTYRQQGVDLAFAAGLMDWEMTDDRFKKALDTAAENGIKIEFDSKKLGFADHPNTVLIHLSGRTGKKIRIVAKSTGGGSVLITRVGKWYVSLNGKSYDVLIVCRANAESKIVDLTKDFGKTFVQEDSRDSLVIVNFDSKPEKNLLDQIESTGDIKNIYLIDPVFYIKRGEELFASAEEMITESEKRGISLGKTALLYEAELLGLTEDEAAAEMINRLNIMKTSVEQGANDENVRMKLLDSSAGRILKAESEGKLALGGIHTRAAAMAMSAMHVSNSMGVVCAAPTGGAAGTIPGVILALTEKMNLSAEDAALALFAASAIGLILAKRATFAAEVAGCQVEIGAAGAMASAAVVEAAGGAARQAADAAAISFQNTMGLVCDLVQGMCEIPCHTRNAVAASSAFVCADLVLGGYQNPVPLDETIDAVYDVGKMLPAELRCTALGGLAVTPSALAMKIKE